MSTININVKVNPYYKGTKALDGNQYALRFHWNNTTEKWYMQIKGLNNDVDIKGIALLTGKDLLLPYGEYELGNLWVIDNSGSNTDPDYDNMGSQYTVEYTPTT